MRNCPTYLMGKFPQLDSLIVNRYRDSSLYERQRLLHRGDFGVLGRLENGGRVRNDVLSTNFEGLFSNGVRQYICSLQSIWRLLTERHILLSMVYNSLTEKTSWWHCSSVWNVIIYWLEPDSWVNNCKITVKQTLVCDTSNMIEYEQALFEGYPPTSIQLNKNHQVTAFHYQKISTFVHTFALKDRKKSGSRLIVSILQHQSIFLFLLHLFFVYHFL